MVGRTRKVMTGTNSTVQDTPGLLKCRKNHRYECSFYIKAVRMFTPYISTCSKHNKAIAKS